MSISYSKKHLVIGSILIYSVLILIFILAAKKENKVDNPCPWNAPCIRFCCNTKTKCNENYIRTNFNASFPEERWIDSNETEDEYRIFYGTPTCRLRKLPKSVSWSFNGVIISFVVL